jgi:hypothetical protein
MTGLAPGTTTTWTIVGKVTNQSSMSISARLAIGAAEQLSVTLAPNTFAPVTLVNVGPYQVGSTTVWKLSTTVGGVTVTSTPPASAFPPNTCG